MNGLSESYLKVQYDIRPAKQVERRMILESLQFLASDGFAIREYQYTGMGSIHFVDFILFHKFLGMSQLLSVEASKEIKNRIKFNRPFDLVQTRIGLIGDVIPELSPDIRHLLWLDYDNVLADFMLQDLSLAVSSLSPGSIILVTLDVEPPGLKEYGVTEWQQYFEDQAGRYLPYPRERNHFTREQIPRLNVDILSKTIEEAIRPRRGLSFAPIVNFMYADGHKMITVGGMIVSSKEKRMLRSSCLRETIYFRDNLSNAPFEIKVPRLTRKERGHLDACMPNLVGWKKHQFELSNEEIQEYKKIYRYLPLYAELFI